MSAPAEQGRANVAVVEVLAAALGIPVQQVRMIAGAGSARKVVEIAGLDAAQVLRRLG